MVVTGAKNEEDSLLAARTIAKILLKLGFSCAVAGFKIQNIVASGDCGFPIRLEGLADEECKFSSVRAGAESGAPVVTVLVASRKSNSLDRNRAPSR
jgi:hypothetical protein